MYRHTERQAGKRLSVGANAPHKTMPQCRQCVHTNRSLPSSHWAFYYFPSCLGGLSHGSLLSRDSLSILLFCFLLHHRIKERRGRRPLILLCLWHLQQGCSCFHRAMYQLHLNQRGGCWANLRRWWGILNRNWTQIGAVLPYQINIQLLVNGHCI